MTTTKTNEPICCAEDVTRAIRPAFPKNRVRLQECFAVLLLDTKNRPIGRPMMIAMGTATSVEVHPRDIFREAVRKNAVSIIIAHNHPSGDPEPSEKDRELTRRVRDAGKLLGITLLDHIVIEPSGRFVSLADRGDI